MVHEKLFWPVSIRYGLEAFNAIGLDHLVVSVDKSVLDGLELAS